MNKDGVTDLILGAYGGTVDNNAGSSFILFGKSDGFSASMDLSTFDGVNGIGFTGVATEDLLGYAASPAGDINNDGIVDILLGSWKASPNGLFSGEAYIVYGRAGINPVLNVAISQELAANTTYRLDYDADAEAAGFTDTEPILFSNTAIPIQMPEEAVGTFQGTLYIENIGCDTSIVFEVSNQACIENCLVAADVCDCVVEAIDNPLDNINLTGVGVISAATYYATQTIAAPATVTAQEPVNFIAGQSILLTPGFEVMEGGEFLAEIGLCETDNNMEEEADDNMENCLVAADFCDCVVEEIDNPLDSINLTSTGAISADIYYATQKITALGGVTDQGPVNFIAGQSILLRPGFEVIEGGELLAKIELCETGVTLTDSFQNNNIRADQLALVEKSFPKNKIQLTVAPNPFKEETTIHLNLPEAEQLSLLLYDQSGRLIKKLLNQQMLALFNKNQFLSLQNTIQ